MLHLASTKELAKALIQAGLAPLFDSGHNQNFDFNYRHYQTNKGIVNPKWWEYSLGLSPVIGWSLITILNKGQ